MPLQTNGEEARHTGQADSVYVLLVDDGLSGSRMMIPRTRLYFETTVNLQMIPGTFD